VDISTESATEATNGESGRRAGVLTEGLTDEALSHRGRAQS